MAGMLTISQAAALLRVTPDTLRSWEAQGRIRSVRTRGHHRRFDGAEVQRLAETLGLTRSRPKAEPSPFVPLSNLTPRLDAEPDFLDEELREARTRVELLKAEEQANRLLDSRQQQERQSALAEQRRVRLEKLKSFGMELGRYSGLSPTWRAALTLELERYISDDQFPLSLPMDEAREFVRAKVNELVLKQRQVQEQAESDHREAAERAHAEQLQQIESARQKARRQSLLEAGITRASLDTLLWDAVDREEAIDVVREALQSRVRADWTEARVRELVRAVLDDFEADDDEEPEDWEEAESDDG